LKTANAARSCPFWEFPFESKYLITFITHIYPDPLESKFWVRERDPRYSERIKKGGPLHSMTRLLIGCMEILFLKLAATIFGLD
jgi:hypothetical protein